MNIKNSRMSERATEKAEALEKIFNGSILVYTINNNKRKEINNKIKRVNAMWEEQTQEDDFKVQFKKPKEESSVVIAQIIMVSDDCEEFKDMIGRSVMINGVVGKTYWLSSDETEELTWIDKSAVYGLIKED